LDIASQAEKDGVAIEAKSSDESSEKQE